MPPRSRSTACARRARVGQRTTLDVLNAQQDLLNARVARVQNERTTWVAMYTLLGAVGRPQRPHPRPRGSDIYDPEMHFRQVRDLWHGLRTPSGD